MIDSAIDPFQILIQLVTDAVHLGEHTAELMLQSVEPCVDRVEPGVDRVEPRVGSRGGFSEPPVDSTVECLELCIDAAFETLETRVHALVKGSDCHSKAADHSIV